MGRPGAWTSLADQMDAVDSDFWSDVLVGVLDGEVFTEDSRAEVWQVWGDLDTAVSGEIHASMDFVFHSRPSDE